MIGHRGGGSGYLPEHTLEAYALGIELGADYVEPDLVATQDGHLIARHEPNLIATTNVSTLPQFAHRKRTVVLDGQPTVGFWASDFTLAEIKQLGAIQPIPERGQQFDGRFKIPTLEEIIDFVKRKSREKDRQIGIYPETKHPTYHQSIGLPLEDRLLRTLSQAGWNHRGAPVIIQSFEPASLKYLRPRTPLRLVQLVDGGGVAPDGTITYAPPFDKPYDWVVSGRPGLFRDLLTPAGLAEVRSYADGVGPWKYYIQSTACKTLAPSGTACADANADGTVNEADRVVLPATDLVQRAHAHRPHRAHLDFPQRALAPAAGRPQQSGQRIPAVLRARRRRPVLRLCRYCRGRAGDVQVENRPRIRALSGARQRLHRSGLIGQAQRGRQSARWRRAVRRRRRSGADLQLVDHRLDVVDRAHQLFERLHLVGARHAALEPHPAALAFDPHARVGEAPVDGDGLDHPRRDFLVVQIGVG